MTAARLLDDLQALLARINDVAVFLAVSQFHLDDRARCSALLGRHLDVHEDEQLLVATSAQETALSVYIDAKVLERLMRLDPFTVLDEQNLQDFCTAVEGVSHFQYLVWCLRKGRQLSLLELEVQAEVDKYAVSTWLLRRQGRCDLPRGLRRRLFDDVSYLAGQSPSTRRRYEEANRLAACFCQRLEYRYCRRRHFRPEAWLRTLQEFYRRPHHQKLSFALQ